MSALYPDLDFTSFPNALDNIALKSNITNASDARLVEQIQNAIIIGDFSAASSILNNNPGLNGKIFNANDFNRIRDALLALERLYKTDIYPYINQKQEEWKAIFNNFNYRGVYSPSTQYYVNNFVDFASPEGVQMYICINQPPVGTTPLNASYWKVFTIRGERGETGEGLSFTWVYNPITQYSTNDIAIYDSKWWIAKQPSRGVTPSEGSAYWSLMLTALPAIQIPVTNIQPDNQILGDQWYKTL